MNPRHPSWSMLAQRAGCRAIRCALVLILVARVGFAQDPPSTPETRPTSDRPPRSATPDGDRKGDVIILLDEEGNPTTLPVSPSLEEFLEKVAEDRQRKPGTQRPEAWLAMLTAVGEVLPDQNNARLSIELGFVIDVEQKSFRFPLQMSEGNIENHRFTGSGRLSFERTNGSSSVVVWLSGKGTHQLTLNMIVPITRAAGGRRLQLALPDSVVSLLELTVPLPRVQIRNAGRGSATVRRVGDAKSVFTVTGPGNAIDLFLQDVPERKQEATEIQSRTLMAAHVARDEVSLRAVQALTVAGGSVDEFEILLPAGFNLLDVTPRTGQLPLFKYTVTAPPNESGQTRVQIQAGESVSGAVELEWLMSMPIDDLAGAESRTGATASVPSAVVVHALQVKDASRQDSYLGVSAREGLRVTPKTDANMQQIGISSFQRLAGSRLVPEGTGFRFAWRTHDEQFRLQLERERIEPGFQLRPDYELQFDESSAVLTARFRLNVYRASLEALRFDWPGFTTEGWRVQNLDDETAIEIDVPPVVEGQSQQVVLRLDQGRTRADGPVTIQVQFQRPFPSDGDEAPLTLPSLVENSAQTRLLISTEPAVRARLEPVAPTRSAATGNERSRAAVASNPGRQRDAEYLVDAGRIEFRVTKTEHDREINVTPDSSVTVTDDVLQIRQNLKYEVMYGELQQVRLLLPSDARLPVFSLHLAGEDEPQKLIPQVGVLTVPETQQLRLELPNGLLGEFRIVAEYSLPYSGPTLPDDAARVSVNLIQCSDATPSESTFSRIEIRSADNVQVRPGSDQWKPELTTGTAPAWVREGLQSSIELQVQATPNRSARSFVIRKAAIQTRLHDRTARTQAAYLIEGHVSFLRMTLPPSINARPDRIRASWDGRPLTGTQFQPGATAGEFVIDTGRLMSDEHHVLTIEFEAIEQIELGAVQHLKLSAPSFSPDAWLAETFWEIVLPDEHHLLIYPDDHSPRFRWVRQTAVWVRKPIERQSTLAGWLLTDIAGTPLELTALTPLRGFGQSRLGNRYQFESFGQSHEIDFHTMSQPTVLLVGSGVALALGFVLLRISVTRHVLTFLTLGFGMTLLGLWHLEVVQLLLQPALFGLLLAIVAARLESRIRRGQQASLVTLSSPSDFLAPGSSVEGPELLDEPVSEGSVA